MFWLSSYALTGICCKNLSKLHVMEKCFISEFDFEVRILTCFDIEHFASTINKLVTKTCKDSKVWNAENWHKRFY